jgi:hypothetical protein
LDAGELQLQVLLQRSLRDREPGGQVDDDEASEQAVLRVRR